MTKLPTLERERDDLALTVSVERQKVEYRDKLIAELESTLAAVKAENAELEFLLNEGGTWEQQLKAVEAERDEARAYHEHFVAENEINKGRATVAESTSALLREALTAAQRFIRNGIELGYIRMPTGPDPAHDTLPMIDAALLKGDSDGAE